AYARAYRWARCALSTIHRDKPEFAPTALRLDAASISAQVETAIRPVLTIGARSMLRNVIPYRRSHSAPLIAPSAAAAACLLFLLGPAPLCAQTQSPSAAVIADYYQELMPTIRQAGKLTVRERDKRFGPVMSSAFDFPTMTRLAVGPAWRTFTPA